MRRPIALRLALLPLLLLAAGCAAKVDTGGGGGDAGPLPDDGTLVLRVSHVGGFVPPASLATRVPMISVYGDGRVITEGPQPAIFPGPALPNLQEQQISADDVAELVDRALRAGVGSPTDLGTPSVTDVPSTRITVWTAGGVRTTEAYALMEQVPASGLTADQQAARRKLLDLVGALTDLPGTLGAAAVPDSRPYQPTRIAGVAAPWTPSGSAGVPEQVEVAWPGPALPGEPQGQGGELACVVAEGVAAKAVMRAAGRATSITPWTYDGRRWTIGLRPLLPDETSCADLSR
ncbi:MAG TPA: hypothetical protein VGD43_15090 [Micromonospora sp.]